MGAFSFTRNDLKKLVILLLVIILSGIGLSVLIIKLGLLDKLVNLARENIILSMCIVVPMILNTLVLFFYGLSISLLPTVVDGVIYNKIFGLFPIYNGIKISKCYYESELKGIIGIVPIISDIIMFAFYVLGITYLFIVEGMFIITPAVSNWGIILFIMFFLNNMIKSYCMGKVAASFDDIIPTKNVAKFYLIPLTGGLIVIAYYIATTVLVFFGKAEAITIKSTLINVLTLIVPFFSPIYTCIAVRGVVKNVYNFYFYSNGGSNE